MNTDTISTGIIAVDYSKSLQNMMADGSYDWVNPSITPKGVSNHCRRHRPIRDKGLPLQPLYFLRGCG
ncbi:hypothetical protein SAMN05443247_03751 [Bradyrhizobium erythrophlei]|nr:hypothetical protein SAMN05443247_03751 [Bradyrhizobium erythrophlei]